jgi:hypothetical protein
MPPFFSFDQGTETHPRYNPANDASPLLGRFRAVPRWGGFGGGGGPAPTTNRGQLGLLSRAGGRGGWGGSVHVGYGAVLLATELDGDEDDDEEDGECAGDTQD